MKRVAHAIWAGEPAVCIAVGLAVIEGIILLPDWRKALTTTAFGLAAGFGIRRRVTPHRR